MPIFSHKDRRIFFIHIPKSGGTSIELCLKNLTGNIELFSRKKSFLIPVTPQHLDCYYIKSLFFGGSNEFSYFTVVRHPLAKVISEYYHANRNNKKPIDFNRWLKYALKNFAKNKYFSDNHLRHQVDFLTENTTVFNFEDGLQHVIDYACEELRIEKSLKEIPHEKKYNKHNININKKSIRLINETYKKDFLFFGYDFIEEQCLSLEDLKNINLHSCFSSGYLASERFSDSELSDVVYEIKSSVFEKSSKKNNIINMIKKRLFDK